jgi:hypothetical protein
MKILGMGANPLNSRDGIIVEGCKAILNINQFDRYLFIDDHNDQSEFYSNEKFDLIVYCGTPWLWDSMQYTAKYRNTMRAILAHPEAKVIWLGIGSSLFISDEKSSILRTIEDQSMLRRTFDGSLVITRDSLAHEILTTAAVKHHNLPCPSYFFNPVCQTSKEYDVIFYHAPETGIANGYFSQQRLEEYQDIFRLFLIQDSTRVEIAVCEPEEVDIVRNEFGEKALLLKDPIDTFHICKNARRVLSGRIHNAVPALVYGAEVGIVPVDSRARVLTDFFDIGVNNVSDLSKIKSCDILKLREDNIETYRSIIKDYLK